MRGLTINSHRGNTHRQWKAVDSGRSIVPSDDIVRTTLFLRSLKFSPTSNIVISFCQVGIMITYAGRSICIFLSVIEVSRRNVSEGKRITCERHRGLVGISVGDSLTSSSPCSLSPFALWTVTPTSGTLRAELTETSWIFHCASQIFPRIYVLQKFFGRLGENPQR